MSPAIPRQPMLSANVIKSAGHALIVGGEACRPQPRQTLQAIGYETDERDNPYAALLELCARPLVYRALVLSLQSIYKEELALISTVRQRFPHVSVWLAHTDGRQAALVEAMRLGAEALVSPNGIHSFGETVAQPQPPARQMTFRPVPAADPSPEPAPEPLARQDKKHAQNEHQDPLLTADELHALLGNP
ncbi:MAG: hypothetical protein QM754_13910 [Tepidisphaeraceae bacterium]